MADNHYYISHSHDLSVLINDKEKMHIIHEISKYMFIIHELNKQVVLKKQ